MLTGRRNGTFVFAGVITVTVIVAACGNNGGAGGGSAFDAGDDFGSSSDATGNSDVKGFGQDGSSSGGGDGSFTGDADFPCDGCSPFPPQGAPTCNPQTLGAPTLVYPLDGMLLPPNMNVLEVQWVPPAGASLFEVDFTNAATDVKRRDDVQRRSRRCAAPRTSAAGSPCRSRRGTTSRTPTATAIR